MNTTTTDTELSVETMSEIASLATLIASMNPPSLEDFNMQVRRIAEHAGVVAAVIYDQMYQHVDRRISKADHPSLLHNAAYHSLVRFRNNKK